MSIASAALTYHLGAFLTVVAQISQTGIDGGIYFATTQALAIAAIAGGVRAVVFAVVKRTRRPSRARLVGGDVLAYFTALAIIAMAALPMDTSGAAAYFLLIALASGTPVVAILATLSMVTEVTRWLQIALAALAAADVILLLITLGMQLAAPM